MLAGIFTRYQWSVYVSTRNKGRFLRYLGGTAEIKVFVRLRIKAFFYNKKYQKYIK